MFELHEPDMSIASEPHVARRCRLLGRAPVRVIRIPAGRNYCYWEPHAFCAACGERIVRAHDGNYLWLVWTANPRIYGDSPPERCQQDQEGVVYFVHRGKCDRAWVAHFAFPGYQWAWCQLEHFPLFLGNNLNVPWSQQISRMLDVAAGDAVRLAGRIGGSAWERLRELVFRRDHFVCQYCGQSDGPLHCDHVVPVSRGGLNTLENLVTACERCNLSKHDRTPEEWQP